MNTYVMLGRYGPEAVKGISAERTKKARDVVKKGGGEVTAMYAMLGERDLLLIVSLPDNDAAVRTSLQLSKLTGIAFSTSPAIDVDKFDTLAK